MFFRQNPIAELFLSLNQKGSQEIKQLDKSTIRLAIVEFNHQHNEFNYYYQINKENCFYMDLIRKAIYLHS